MKLFIFDRTTKKIFEEKVYGALFLRALYPANKLGQIFVWPLLQLLCRLPFFSALYGLLQKRPASQKKITPFIANYGLDTNEFEKESFTSFNDFFIRRLKKTARPIEKGITAPADGRYRFIPDISKANYFYVKGQRFDLKSFLQNDALAEKYASGSMVIARLAPPDYHRYHYPIDGERSANRRIGGPLFSVNPLSLKQNLTHLTNNKRFITSIAAQHGEMLFIEIGATNVGSVHETGPLTGPVKKGSEKGYFSFGASALVLLFESGKITFSRDLLNPPDQCEIRCLMGQTIATSNKTC